MDLGGQPAPIERLLDREQELVPVERFPDEVVRPLPHRRHGGLDVSEGGDDEDGDVGRLAVDLPEHLHPRNSRHLEVGDHEVEGGGRERGQPLGPVFGRGHFVPGLPEIEERHLPAGGVVVDEKDAPGHGTLSFGLIPRFYQESPRGIAFCGAADAGGVVFSNGETT